VTTRAGPLTSLGNVLDRAAARLEAAGVPNARHEARILWASLCERAPAQAWLDRDHAAAPAAAERFDAAVAARASGLPTQYASGRAAFRHLDLLVDRRVLIPRPETEGLVEHVLRHFRLRAVRGDGARRGSWGVAVDVGTGSGCVALSLATEGQFARVIATDTSPDALAVARANARRVRAAVTVEFCRGDLLAPVGMRVAAVVSNPPYIADADMDVLDAGVRDYEPAVALSGGPDGMVYIRRLVLECRSVIHAGGLLAIEIDSARATEALEQARAAGWTDARVERDLFDRPRYLLATREPK